MNSQPGTVVQDLGNSAQNNPQSPSMTLEVEAIGDSHPLHVKSGWVTKHDRHMQLINSSIFQKETQVRSKAIEETRRQKAAFRDQREKQKIERHLKTLASGTGHEATTSMDYEIIVNGISYNVVDGGSKLARVPGDYGIIRLYRLWHSQRPGATDSAKATPKKANIGGVIFLRSKNGNLYRSGAVKAKRCVLVLSLA